LSKSLLSLLPGFRPASMPIGWLLILLASALPPVLAAWLAHVPFVCIPPKSNRLVQHLYNKALCRTWQMVENSV